MPKIPYRGRIAPTPSGYLHLGHLKTFGVAMQRANSKGGSLILRIEDLDLLRCKPIFLEALYEDLRKAGIRWDEGPEQGGNFGPYLQSLRRTFYLEAWAILKERGYLYPCAQSRKDVLRATQAPNDEGVRECKELIFPKQLRASTQSSNTWQSPSGVNWRFQVPDGEIISFIDQRLGLQCFKAGIDFGDFIVWRKDDIPAYELAVVVDDYAMQISEVVRGEDLLLSTARQFLLYKALGWAVPQFYHTPLVRGSDGLRLAKSAGSPSLRELRALNADFPNIF